VSVSTAETDDGRLIDDDLKSRAGIRTVSFPREIVPELRWHLECFAQADDGGLVFIGPLGGRLRRKNFRKFWVRARDSVGLPGLHFHDLRHTGNTMAAAQGASLRELMELMGHSSSRAALIYQHATRERDEEIAAGMGKLLSEAKRRASGPADRARSGHAAGNASHDDRQRGADHASDLGGNNKSGRRESNPHDQLGRSVLAHGHLYCSSNALVSRSAFLRSVTAYLSVLLATGPQMARRLRDLLDANYWHDPARGGTAQPSTCADGSSGQP